MDMQLSWIKDFLALVEVGGFSRAAERRNVSQPVISRRIQALEEWMGAKLFERSTHSVTITAAGTAFRPIAEDILRRISAGREEVLEAVHATSDGVRFAGTHTLSQRFFPNWIQSLQTDGHMATVQIFAANLSICERLLADGEAHFLLSHSHPQAPGRTNNSRFHSLVIGQECIIPVTAPVAKDSAEPKYFINSDLSSTVPYLAYLPGSGLGRILSYHLRAAAVSSHLHEVFSGPASLLVEMARAGLGVAWAPKVLVEDDFALNRLMPAGDATHEIRVDVTLVRSRARLKPTAEAFWARAKDHAKRHLIVDDL